MNRWLGKVNWQKHSLNQDFEIVLIGDRKSLDSPLMDNLLGKCRTSRSKLKSSRRSKTFLTVDRMHVSVHLVPALSDATGYKDEDYIQELQSTMEAAHLVIFCVDMSDTRLRGSVLRTLQQLKIQWSLTVIVFTFADALPALMRHWETPNFPKGQYFNSKLAEWTDELKAVLKHVGLDEEMVAKMKFYPSANAPDELLPNGEPWLAPLSLAIMGIVSSKQKEEFLEEHAMLFSTGAVQQIPTLSPTDAAAAALATVGVRERAKTHSGGESYLHSSPELSDDQSRSINEALCKLREYCPVFGILVIGRTGVGKSTLINNLLGKDVAIVGHKLQSETPEVYPHEYSVEGVAIVVYDTPGLGDVKGEENERRHLEVMKDLLARGKIHLVVYCFQMTETTMKSSLVGTLRKYHEIGVDWGRSIIALTFADALYVPKSHRKRPNHMSLSFEERLAFWQSELRQVLVGTVGVAEDVVRQLKICPTAPLPKDQLPNGSRWYVPLWLHIVEILPPAATVRFVDIHKGNICDNQTPPRRRDCTVEVNLSGEDRRRFASSFAAAVEAGRNEPMPSPSMRARVEMSFCGQDRNQFAVTMQADERVISEDGRAVVMSVMISTGGIHQFFPPTEQTHPREREQCPRMNLTCCCLCCIRTSSRDREDGQGRSAVVASSDV